MKHEEQETALPVVAVIGAGTMGHALALVHALGGCQVALHDVNAEVLSRASVLIDGALSTLGEAGALGEGDAEMALGRIRMTGTLEEAVEAADLIVEAVVECVEVKQAVFGALDDIAPKHTIIASNTSFLDIFPLIPERRQPSAAVAHWYTPPYLIDLVDIAPGPATAPETVEMLRSLYLRLGKAPLVFDRLIPGYIANRLQAALNLECLRMIEEGWADAEAIDTAILHGLVTRLAVMGHMRKMDFTGLEMVRNGLASRSYTPPLNDGKSPVLDRLIAAGRRGVVSGAGFYNYGARPAAELLRERDLQLFSAKMELAKIRGGAFDDHG